MEAIQAPEATPRGDSVDGWVSVIVPTRNSSKTIEACLESVRGQTYGDVELIVVDNYSLDGTPEIASRFADLILVTGPERSAQRNAGADDSCGEFLLFVDSDMMLSPSVVEDVVQAFRGDPQVQALVIPERSIGVGFWARCRALEKELYLGDPDMEAARAFRRTAFSDIGGYDASIMAGGEDWDLPERLKGEGGSIGRVVAPVFHNEGELSLSVDLRKKFYYGGSLLRYVSKHPKNSVFKIVRRSWFRNILLLFWQNPTSGLGLIALKLLEAGAVMAGMLTRRVKDYG